jgi:CRISPR-associated endonuclease Csn1
LLKNEKYFGENWNNFSLQKQDEIVEYLLEEDDEIKIENKALNEWQVNEIQAKNLAKLTINSFAKTSVGAMCKEILQKLCEEISNKNCLYHQALENLGIKHSDEDYNDGSKDALTYYGEAIPASVVAVKPKLKNTLSEEEEFGKIANPTVHVALNQLRKVVNSIIKNHGKPTEIHVELARNLKQTKDEKKQTENQQKQNEKENKEAKEFLNEFKQINNYENRLRYKLWKELNKDKCLKDLKIFKIKMTFGLPMIIVLQLPAQQILIMFD